MATVIIPTPLRKFTNNTARLQVRPGTIQETVQELSLNFPDLKKHLLDENGKIRSYVNIFIGNDDIRDLQQEHTAVQEGAVVSIVPAIAGGFCRQLHRVWMKWILRPHCPDCSPGSTLSV